MVEIESTTDFSSGRGDCGGLEGAGKLPGFLKVVALEVFWEVPFTLLGLHLLQEASPEPLSHCRVFHPHLTIDVCIRLLPRLELLKGKCVILESRLSLYPLCLVECPTPSRSSIKVR